MKTFAFRASSTSCTYATCAARMLVGPVKTTGRTALGFFLAINLPDLVKLDDIRLVVAAIVVLSVPEHERLPGMIVYAHDRTEARERLIDVLYPIQHLELHFHSFVVVRTTEGPLHSGPSQGAFQLL